MEWALHLLCILGFHSWGDPDYVMGRITGVSYPLFSYQHCTRKYCSSRRRTI